MLQTAALDGSTVISTGNPDDAAPVTVYTAPKTMAFVGAVDVNSTI